MSKTYLQLHTACVAVKGHQRSTICDLARGELAMIPNDLYDIIDEARQYSVEEIRAAYGPESKPVLDEYFQYLIDQEYAFYTRQRQKFEPLPQQFDLPWAISNAIIDIGHDSRHDYKAIFSQLDELGCKFIQLRSYQSLSLEALQQVLDQLKGYRFRSVELIAAYHPDLQEQHWAELYNTNDLLVRVTVHSAPTTKEVGEGGRLVLTEQVIDSCQACGFIDQHTFSINVPTYTEGLQYNTCLNRKLSIDQQGYIKNCPSMSQHHGHVQEVKLAEVVAKKEFTKYWHINKDQIKVCQDCEFRRVCTDCRVYLADSTDLNSKPARCGYDPYTATWQQGQQ